MRLDAWTHRSGADYYADRYPPIAAPTRDPLQNADSARVDPARLRALPQGGMQTTTTAAPSAASDAPPPIVQFPQTQRTTEPQRFGDPAVQPITANVASQIVLAKPPTRRTFLMLQNTSALNDMYVSFGSAASSVNGVVLAPGQSLSFSQFVPQNDIHVAAAANGTTGMLAFANKGDNE